jgi:hypothetical protein
MEEESEALRHVSKEVIREMENLELYSLLSLIPEDCDNFKLLPAEDSWEGGQLNMTEILIAICRRRRRWSTV